MFLLEKTFNDQIFFQVCHSGCNLLFNITKIDTSSFYLSESKQSNIKLVHLLKVKVLINEPINKINNNKSSLINDTLTYYILNNENNFYKLFGFYNTDINLYYSYEGQYGLKELQEALVKTQTLSKSQSKKFLKSVLNNKSTYPECIDKPCNILTYYFSIGEKKFANTIILPLKPLLPLYIN